MYEISVRELKRVISIIDHKPLSNLETLDLITFLDMMPMEVNFRINFWNRHWLAVSKEEDGFVSGLFSLGRYLSINNSSDPTLKIHLTIEHFTLLQIIVYNVFEINIGSTSTSTICMGHT